MFAHVSKQHPSLIFVIKDNSLIKQLSSDEAHSDRLQNMLEVADDDKRTSLLHHSII